MVNTTSTTVLLSVFNAKVRKSASIYTCIYFLLNLLSGVRMRPNI